MKANAAKKKFCVLLVYPEFPDTFWSLKHALRFVSKKANYPPLGLLTVAGMLPDSWELRLVDMNVSKLKESHLRFADMVLVSAMSVQKASADRVIARCKKAGVKTVAGGPLFTAWHEMFDHVDHLVLNEAELTMPFFLEDFKNGEARHIYTSKEYPDIKKTCMPRWDLIDMNKYASMNIQYSRGCPFDCEFCEIIVLYGRVPRLKDTGQIVSELQWLYDHGWRGSVFFVDDNFIANGQRLKKEVLPAIAEWNKNKGYPFLFHTEVSINLADDEELMKWMADAGFDMVFVGIESPHEDSLSECNKYQNMNRDLLGSVAKIQAHGLQVEGGFIVGFDNDPDSIFDTLIKFITQSRIVIAMVGLLNAPKGTKLYEKMKKQHRLRAGIPDGNTDFSINFSPAMEYDKLLSGYKRVLDTIYSPKNYYQRIVDYLKKTRLNQHKQRSKIRLVDVAAFVKSIFWLGIIGKERKYYWKLIFHMLKADKAQFPAAISFAIMGYHFRKIYRI